MTSSKKDALVNLVKRIKIAWRILLGKPTMVIPAGVVFHLSDRLSVPAGPMVIGSVPKREDPEEEYDWEDWQYGERPW